MATNSTELETPNSERITAIILAAGLSRRMGEANKLLLPLDGRPLIVHAVESVQVPAVDRVVVVTGYDRKAVERAVAETGARCVHNPNYETGMASSLVCGVRASPETAGLLLHLGDVPHVREDTVQLLCATLREAESAAIVRPTYDEVPGHPVLFHAAFREDLLATTGDSGARSVLRAHPEALMEVPVDDPGVRRDVDTRDAYRRLR